MNPYARMQVLKLPFNIYLSLKLIEKVPVPSLPTRLRIFFFKKGIHVYGTLITHSRKISFKSHIISMNSDIHNTSWTSTLRKTCIKTISCI